MSDSAASRSPGELHRSGLDSEPFPMRDSAAARVLESIGRLQDATAATEYETLVDALVDALADDTTVADLRQELAFRDAEIERLRERC